MIGFPNKYEPMVGFPIKIGFPITIFQWLDVKKKLETFKTFNILGKILKVHFIINLKITSYFKTFNI